jgi:hypothetical protein
VLVHSPKAAAAIAGAAVGALAAYCISSAAAAPLAGAVKRLTVAAEPDETHLLALLAP